MTTEPTHFQRGSKLHCYKSSDSGLTSVHVFACGVATIVNTVTSRGCIAMLVAILQAVLLCGCATNVQSLRINSNESLSADRYSNVPSQAFERGSRWHRLPMGVSRTHARHQKKHVRAFVGVMTGFKKAGLATDVYKERREALRATWFPRSLTELKRWETEYGIVIRFVIGKSGDAAENHALDKEAATHKDFLRLGIQEAYGNLGDKTRAFFKAAAETYIADWFVKMDDDVYLRQSHLLGAMSSWDTHNAGYVGCFNRNIPIVTNADERWYEQAHEVIVNRHYWIYAKGLIYALNSQAVWSVIIHNYDQLRLITNEDANMGLWMLAHNVKRHEDLRLCHQKCMNTSVAIIPDYYIDTTGKDMEQLHANLECHR